VTSIQIFYLFTTAEVWRHGYYFFTIRIMAWNSWYRQH